MRFKWIADRDDSPKSFFSKNEKEKIVEAVRALEQKTSAELRVHVERRKKKGKLIAQAEEAFEAIGMTKTDEKNGVLIFICSDTHEFAVLGDKSIDSRVPPSFWADAAAILESNFRKGLFLEGVLRAIEMLGEPLTAHFPRQSGDRNELSDDISSR